MIRADDAGAIGWETSAFVDSFACLTSYYVVRWGGGEEMDTVLASATVFIVDDDPAMRDSMSFLVL